ncbi:unnamed protein product [Diamesa serratosioi]
MKLIAFVLLVIVGLVSCDSVQLSDNNIGDIVTIEINANALFSNQVDKNTINVIAGLLNQQGTSNAEEEKTTGDDAVTSINKKGFMEAFLKFLKSFQDSIDDSTEDSNEVFNSTTVEATTKITSVVIPEKLNPSEIVEKSHDLPLFDKISPKLLAALAKFQNGKLMN